MTHNHWVHIRSFHCDAVRKLSQISCFVNMMMQYLWSVQGTFKGNIVWLMCNTTIIIRKYSLYLLFSQNILQWYTKFLPEIISVSIHFGLFCVRDVCQNKKRGTSFGTLWYLLKTRCIFFQNYKVLYLMDYQKYLSEDIWNRCWS